MNKKKTLDERVLKLESDFVSGTGTLMSKYVTTDLYEDINKIYAYLESKHISGETDSLGREKPFFNIVLAARNIWYRATDIDRKDIKIKATKSADTVGAFLLNVHLQNWMRKENFGTFLNTWGIELAGFNSAVCKFVEKDGKLTPMVVPWSRLIVDQVNFDDNIKIELLELTEEQLYERGYDEKAIEELCTAAKSRELTNKQKKDNKNNYYKLYEVHGKLPLSYLTGEEKDEDVSVQQMHVLSFLKKDRKNDQEEFVLYKGKEAKDPYMLTSLLPTTDGSISLNGSVKNLFEAQWMMNHTAKAIKDQLDLASKLIFQTADGNFVGQNALNAIESGDILIHELNKPLTQLANNSHDVGALQNFGAQWKQLSAEINGVSEAMLGANPPAGSAWRQTEALLAESHSLFEIMIENKGLCIEKMMREYIIPFLKKKMDTAKEVSTTLNSYDLKRVDDKFIPAESDRRLARKVIKRILATGETPRLDEQMRQDEITAVKAELEAQGNQRFFKPEELTDKTWKELFKDLEEEVEVDVSGESTNPDAMTTINSLLMFFARKQGQPLTPQEELLVNKILTMTATVSPLELSGLENRLPTSAPLGGQVVAEPMMQ